MPRICANPERLAVLALTNQLRLAIHLLTNAAAARATVAREEEIIASARDAYRHAVEALGRLPRLPAEDLKQIHQEMVSFRAILANLIT